VESGHPSAAGRAQDSERSRISTNWDDSMSQHRLV